MFPTQVLAGVTVPDTPLITKALAFAKSQLDPLLYNHVVRSWLFGAYIASQTSENINYDAEVHAITAILHDMGWSTNSSLVSPDKRFEVDGANAARSFLKSEGSPEEWNEHRLQLAWDAVALHTTPSIAAEKESEVKICLYGITTDFLGPEKAPSCPMPKDIWNGILREFPRDGFKEGAKEAICCLCQRKPETTYDNFTADFGVRFVDGYSLEGKRAIDIILAPDDWN